MRYSIIIPLFNRPEEIRELLDSLTTQEYWLDTEVIIVEDGSTIKSNDIVASYTDRLDIKYLEKENSGPAMARNYGVKHSCGEWLIFLDSDTVMPKEWLQAVNKEIVKGEIDAYGGPDRASKDFSPIQKAINYSMTSLFTTGGIRGNKKSVEKFHPRSFNMGIRREWFDRVDGFAQMRFGEDVDLSIRLIKAGARTVLIPEAWVYHKRRVDFKKFFRQVRASGAARIALSKKHPGTLKIVHLLPLCFTIFAVATVVALPFIPYVWAPIALWAGLITIDATIKNGGIELGILSLVASVVQLTGYGIGFLMAMLGGGKNLDRKFYK